MPSNTSITRLRRKKKDKPNKANLRAYRKRLASNIELLRQLEAADQKEPKGQ